jgi:hypothetical protein
MLGMSFRTSHNRGGEKMKKKILVIPVFLLTFALLSLPVMAVPATKIEGVTLMLYHTPSGGPQHIVDHTIIHTIGTSYGPAILTIPTDQDPLELQGIWDTDWFSTQKLSDGIMEGNLIRENVTLTFTDESTGYPDTTGTFYGRAQWKWFFTDGTLSSITAHMVLRGTGDFKGQTLKLSYEPALPPVIEGCLIIPK